MVALAIPLLLFTLTLTVMAAESEYRRCEAGTTCQIGEFLYDDDYVAVPPANASCNLAVRNPSGTLLNDPPGYYTMSETADGWYSYDFSTTGQTNGLYRSNMCCTITTPSQTLCLDKSFNIVPATLTASNIATAVWSNVTRTLTSVIPTVGDIATAVWGYSTRSLNSFGTLVTAVWSNVTRTLTTAIPSAADTAAAVWSSVTRSLTTRSISGGEEIASEETLEKRWTTRFSGDGEVFVSKAYRAKLWVLDYNTELADAVSDPEVTIYDSNRAIPPSAPTEMTKIADGTYEIVWTVPTGSAAGRWETVVTIDVGGAAPIQDGSYWEVETDSPAEVKIIAITDNTVPSIKAKVKIKNEGESGWYEYKYAYCVVDDQSNQCGGGDDTYYNSGSKKIYAGQSWKPTLSATVPNPGTYFFKLIVYWGTERSSAVLQFDATEITCLGDYNSDGWVDLTDFSIMLFYWNKNNAAHDLSGDGKVNLTDFSILLFHWGKCP